MRYQFNIESCHLLQQAFSQATVVWGNNIQGQTFQWQYIFFKFENPIELAKKELEQDICELVFAGDAEYTKHYTKHFRETFFNWV